MYVRTRAELVRSRRNRRVRSVERRKMPAFFSPLSLSCPLVERICLSRLALQLPLKLREPSSALLLLLLLLLLLSSPVVVVAAIASRFSFSFSLLFSSSSFPPPSFFLHTRSGNESFTVRTSSHFLGRKKNSFLPN